MGFRRRERPGVPLREVAARAVDLRTACPGGGAAFRPHPELRLATARPPRSTLFPPKAPVGADDHTEEER
jgi:hypothetical protein